MTKRKIKRALLNKKSYSKLQGIEKHKKGPKVTSTFRE